MAALSGFATYLVEPRMMRTKSLPSSSSSAGFCFPSQNGSVEKHSSSNFCSNPVWKKSQLCMISRCKLSTGDATRSKASSLNALELLKSSAPNRYTKEKSCIVVMGLYIHTAPVEIREKLAIPEAQWSQAIGELCALNHIEEAAILSTCNRMEVYVLALSRQRGVQEVTEWMSKMSGVPIPDLNEHRFLLYNNDASQHLFEVASGLNSLVLGEGQILSQVRHVVKAGEGVPGFGRKISGLFKHAISVGKRVRSETKICSGSVTVSSAAVDLALLKLPEHSYGNVRVLVVGAGKMGKLVIQHLVAKGCTKMVVVNRSEDRVASIRQDFNDVEIEYKPLSDLMACAAESDVIFTSTASKAPLFLKEHVETIPPLRPEIGQRKIFVDISVPRNVEPRVSELETASVYNVDDLREVVASNKDDRHLEAIKAKDIVLQEVKQFEAWKDSLETVPTLKSLWAYGERIRSAELDKCFSKLGDGISDKQKKAVEDLTKSIVKKILHSPTQHLRCDGNGSRTLNEILENMHALNRIFELDTDTSILEKIKTKMEQARK